MSYLYFSLELISECLCYLCGIYFFTKVSLTKNIKIYACILVVFVVLVCAKGCVDISFYKAWVCTLFQMVCLFLMIDGTIKNKIFYSISAPVVAAFFDIIVIIFCDFDIYASAHGQRFNYTWFIMFILTFIVGIIIKKKIWKRNRVYTYAGICICSNYICIFNYFSTYYMELSVYTRN